MTSFSYEDMLPGDPGMELIQTAAGEGIDMGGHGKHEDNGNHGREAAKAFLKVYGLDNPSDDTIAQLTEVFVPCLLIMEERAGEQANYGEAWRDGGWRGCLWEMRKRMDRLWEGSWRRPHTPRRDLMFDFINYTGFGIRAEQSLPWGTWGAPDSADE